MRHSNWILTFFLIFFIISMNSDMNSTKVTNATLSSSPETPPAIFSVADSEGPIIGTPTLDNPNPDSDEAVDVTVPIYDIDGVRNATLFWEYTSINNTQFNSTVIGTTPNNIVDAPTNTDFDGLQNGVTGYTTGTGLKDPASPTDWRYGEYIYNTSVVSDVDIEIRAAGGSSLVYVVIKAKNITTGEWQTVYDNGGYGLNDSYDLGSETYSNSTLTLGYQILAVTFRDPQPPGDPQFNTLTIVQEVCEWTIPTANEPTSVDYNIQAFDNLNQSKVSPTDTFLMDFTPSFYFNIPPPSTVRGDEEISFTGTCYRS